MAAVKSYDTLIRAFARLRKTLQARLIIAGEGPERATLEELAKSLGVVDDVDMPGFVQNPFAYMSRASVFVLSSTYEGLPNALIEAMACGCPVVSTNCPSGPEEILRGGKYGHLVPVHDIEAMARAIELVLKGDRRLPPVNWLEQYRIDRVADHYRKALMCPMP